MDVASASNGKAFGRGVYGFFEGAMLDLQRSNEDVTDKLLG